MLSLLIIVLTLSSTSTLQYFRLAEASAFQQNANSISGHVSDDRRTPVGDIRVELLNEVDSVIQTVKTNGSGLFVFRKLSDGTFHVRVQTAGTNYVSQTKRVELARPHGFGVAFEEVDFILVTGKTNTGSTKADVVFVQEVPDAARKLYQRGAELVQKSEKRQEGVAALKSALGIYPQYFDALELLGTEQVKQQDYDSAIPVLTKACEINPRSQASWLALGVAQYNLKQVPAGVESFRRAVLIKENSINANLWLGIALRQTGPLDEAESYLKKADRLADSKLPDAHWQLALLFNQQKRFDEAADQLEVFLKVQPDSRDAEKVKKLIQRFREQSASSPKKP